MRAHPSTIAPVRGCGRLFRRIARAWQSSWLALLILGSLGTLLGNLIKAAIGRQREFLADASAVQFTRNPQGLSGALKKIGGCTAGSRLKAFNAAQYSHMYFHQGVQSRLDRLFATHPPLAERIRRLDPQWDGRFKPL
ncbi:M48 family metalloprotease [Pseudomonas sp. MPFS]|uniref:M48 family metalloprotease n=1 Tax=Pseudomonas sp. MPFS TaxID=2795724 RepID=UPI001F14104C|nr:M48 family metalloprotease [Pseudomonas sp. MPFS]